jgi:hypothetical protein
VDEDEDVSIVALFDHEEVCILIFHRNVN